MLCSITMGQNIISLSSKTIDNTKSIVPQRNVEYVDDGLIITYRFEAGVMTKDPLCPNSVFWNIDGFGQLLLNQKL